MRRLLAPLSFAASSAAVAIWQCLRRRPDVVMVVEPALFAAPAGLLGARLVGARTVLHVQDLEVEAAFAVGHLGKSGVLSRLAAWFDATVTKAFDRVITISDRMAERLVAKGVAPDRVQVIRNWVDVDEIRPLDRPSPYRSELGLTEGQFVALYAGNLGVKQGVRVLVEAARLLKRRSDIVFVVAGEGPMRPTLETAARELPNLRLLPFQPEARMCDFLGLADAHLLPQERDAADLLLPSKLGGMLASGRQVVVTAEAGTELVDFLGASCLFTPPGDAAALAAAIAQLCDGEDFRAGEGERLRRAAMLSKTRGIARFTAAALFDEDEHGRPPIPVAA